MLALPRRSRARLVLLVCVLALAACKGDDAVGPEDGADLSAVVTRAEDLTTFRDALETAGLAATLRVDGPYTVFAPTDVAFLRLGGATTGGLLDPENRALLQRVLRHHIVPGHYRLADLQDGMALETLDGTPLVVSREGDVVLVGGAELIEADEAASNGVLHRVDIVFREHLTTADRLTLTPLAQEFVDLVAAAGASDVLASAEPHTVFVATTDAFAALGQPALNLLTADDPILRRVVDFHLVPSRVDLNALGDGATLTARDGTALTLTRDADGVTFVGGRRVLAAPVPTANGVLVLVDGLLLDPLRLDERLRIAPALQTFEGFTRTRGLTPLLAGDAPYTVFAPTDFAFTLFPDVVLDALQQPENAALFDRVLQVHIVPGRFEPDDLRSGVTLQTLEGATLEVARQGESVSVGGFPVVFEGGAAANGWLYGLDGVIRPETDLLDGAVLRGLTIYATAVRRAGLEGLLRGPGPLTAFGPTNSVFQDDPTLLTRPDLADVLLDLISPEPIPTLTADLPVNTLGGQAYVAGIDPLSGPYLLRVDPTPDGDPTISVGALGSATNGHLYSAQGIPRP